jgi:hypothetical protein
MQGRVGKIWDNETKDKKRYTVLEIGGEKYSVWEAALVEGLAEGDSVEYDWKQSGNFRKITGLKKLGLDPGFEDYTPGRKSLEIIRMSCLRSASELVQGTYKDPDQRKTKALDIAREFEKYVIGLEEEDHGGQPAEEKPAESG